MNRVSIRGGVFSGIPTDTNTQIKVVILNAANVARSYYADEFSVDSLQLPTCWSVDTQRPATEVLESRKQSARCIDCTQNIRGSAKGAIGRACRYFQLLAVAEEHDLRTVYRLQVPSASIFGKGSSDNKMSLEGYAKFLTKHGTPSQAVVTRISFDDMSTMPKICFDADRALGEEELIEVREMVDHPDTLEAITFNVDPRNLSPFSVVENGFVFNGDQNG